MNRTKGQWIVKATIQKYQSKWLDVCEDKVIQPNGKPGSFANNRMSPGVSVLAVNEGREVYLTSEYR